MSKFRTSVVRQLEAEQAKLTPLSPEVFWHLYEDGYYAVPLSRSRAGST